LLLSFDLAVPNQAAAQNRGATLVSCFRWPLVSAEPAERALPAMALAPLSHRLIKGFFFVQGLAMSDSFDAVSASMARRLIAACGQNVVCFCQPRLRVAADLGQPAG
jgi:hypothetical protein